MKHTPLPWTRVPQTQGGDLIAHEYETGDQMNPKGLRLIAFMMARGNSLAEDEANANLITAAPALLSALKECVEALAHMEANGWRVNPPTLDTARAALAQAAPTPAADRGEG